MKDYSYTPSIPEPFTILGSGEWLFSLASGTKTRAHTCRGAKHCDFIPQSTWLTLGIQIIFITGHKLNKHLLQGTTGWRSKSSKSLQEGNPGEGRTGRLYQHPGSLHTGIPLRFPGRQPRLERAASLSGIAKAGGKKKKKIPVNSYCKGKTHKVVGSEEHAAQENTTFHSHHRMQHAANYLSHKGASQRHDYLF